MRLLSLELNGFKSFAQKTKIEFMPGMTGIVGPNGSGKSNIIEAIRWVMGEQSAKDLRGDKMADVIFAGSATRKPLNRAEVSITFDNQDHYLSSDYTEIKITRKLYRSGESQYLINGQECRLKDVLDLFMDSGLGRESFSIISQGRVEAIFNGKPADRRAVIEEVAGVAKYKKNKTTAEKRLVDTTDNLHRVNDIISELETQLEPLAQQSALAKEYQTQKAQFDQLDRTKTVLDIQALKQQQTATTAKQTDLQQLVTSYTQQTQTAGTKLDQLKAQQVQATATKDQLQEQLLTLTKQIAEINNTLNLSAERSSQQKINLAQIAQQTQQLQEQKQAITQELTEVTQILEQQTQKIQAVQAQIKQITTLDAQQQAELLTQKIEQLQNKQVDQMQALTTVHNQKTFLTRSHEQDSQRQQQAQAEFDQVQAQFAALQQTLNEQQATRDQLATQLAESQQKLDTETVQQQTLKTRYDTTQKQWFQVLGKVQSLEARRNSLKSLENEYAGFYQGVRTVLQHRDQFPGLLGPVAELINVPTPYTQAIETVLGAQLQNLVVDTQATGKAIIHYLVQHRAGRATILPIQSLANRLPNRSILDRVANMPGYCGLASELVTVDQSQQVVLNHLLSNTIITDTLDNATQISKQTQHRFRIVTLDGQLINASGSMTGGANKQQRQGILSRQSEVDQLTQQLAKTQANAQQLETTIQKYDTAARANQEVIGQLRQSTQALNQTYQAADNKLNVLQARQKMSERQLTALKYEVGQQGDSSTTYEQQLVDNDQQEAQINTALADLKQTIEQTKQQLKEVQQSDATRQTQLQEKQQWLAVAQEKLDQTQRHQAQLQQQRQVATQQLSHLTQQSKQATQSKTEREAERSQAMDTLKQLNHQQTATNEELATVNEQLNAQATSIETATQSLDRLNELQKAAMNELDDVHAENAKLATQLDHGLNRLSENYAMTFEEAQRHLSSLAPDQIASQLKLLKRGLDEIGPVNLGSIEEYERVNQRYTFLHEQQHDLLSAKQQLNDTMQEMDQEVKTRFNDSYQQVATSFAHIFAQMFGGGQARLVLTEPDNLLESGIDIIAQPPGKKNQQMSLLSGGEKALTAITLLFAILEVRPVPFAILDETEAALDEANVTRFARYLSRYGDHGPQFIVVTHRKGTMMNANVLYGVTMQESGVSKMVSVSLEDVPV